LIVRLTLHRCLQPFGILPTLDDETIVGDRGSDQNFMAKLRKNNKTNPVYQNDPKSKVHFIVNHYAGKVRYAGLGFLEKNRDTLTTDLVELLQTSTQPLVNQLYPPNKAVSSKEKKASLSKQFQSQLNTLMRRLNKTQPHYIRCVKPNNDKRPKYFVPRNCFEQLKYSGVFEAVAIRKQGYPFRLSHAEFASRYGIICKSRASGSPKDTCRAIIKELKLSSDNVKVGVGRILYRAEEYRKLELDWSIKSRHTEIRKNIDRMVGKNPDGMSKEEKEVWLPQPCFVLAATSSHELIASVGLLS